MPLQLRRLLGVLLLVAGILAVYAAYVRYQQEHPDIQIEVLGERPLTGINPSPAPAGMGDPPRIDVPAEAAKGRTLYVSARARANGDGTFAKPLNDFQQAICSLQPGDRLLVMAGAYSGKFLIGGDCVDGTADAPIEVYFSDDSVFGGHEGKGTVDEAVITVQRAHWRLGGVEIQPIHSKLAMSIEPGAEDIIIDGAHIYGGIGTGIRIAGGTRAITVTNSHLHQLGTLEGRSNQWEKGGGSAILIEDGTDGVIVRNNNIHNILGKAIDVAGVDSAAGNGAGSKTAPVLENNSVNEGQEIWW